MPESDKQSFIVAIANQYGKRLRRFLSSRLSNTADVPDLAQEVFLRLLRVERFEGIQNPEAYLFTIASHVVHQHTVRRLKEPLFVDIADVFIDAQTLSENDPAKNVENVQRIDEFERVLAQLPVRVATALVLHRIGGYTVQEIGDQLGVSRETAKKYLARGLEFCRDRRMRAE